MRIALINMPFAMIKIPSLALSQLQGLVASRHGERVTIDVHYLNHDFAHYFGGPAYYEHALSMDGLTSGLGDWFFRQAAFPTAPDNSIEYFRRYYYRPDEQTEGIKRLIRAKRAGLEEFLDELIEKYALDQVDVAGFTSLFFQNTSSFALARKLKERDPSIVTIMGGAACEGTMGQEIAVNVPQVDFVFSGPGLKSFSELVGNLLDGNEHRNETIHGVFSKQNRTRWRQRVDPSEEGVVRLLGEDLDIDTPIPIDYSPFVAAFESAFANGTHKPVLLFETSRGCWWGERSLCTFCGLNGSTINYRAMSSDKAVAELEKVFRYAPRCLSYSCVDNIMPQSFPRDVFPRLDPPPGALIFYEVKSNLKPDALRRMSKAGVKVVQPGIEALSTSTLELMKKGATAFGNLSFLKNCLLCDVYPIWFLLVGFPREEESVYEKYVRDIPTLTHLPPPLGVLPVRFDRYSHYFLNAEAYGLDLHPFDFYGLTYPFEDESLFNLAYYFMDHNGSAPYVRSLSNWFQQMKDVWGQWYASWHEADRSEPPRLYLEGDSTVVVDTRSTQALRHDVGDDGCRILQALQRPMSLERLKKELGTEDETCLEDSLSDLRERGLLFEEDGRFLCLVHPECPAPMDYRSRLFSIQEKLDVRLK